MLPLPQVAFEAHAFGYPKRRDQAGFKRKKHENDRFKKPTSGVRSYLIHPCPPWAFGRLLGTRLEVTYNFENVPEL